MRCFSVLALLALVGSLPAQTPAAASKPQKKPATPATVQAGYAMIRQGRLSQALAHFKKLEVDQPGNRWSKKAIPPLTKSVQLEKISATDEHPKWVAAAEWLQRFYTANKVPTGLLALSQRACAKFPGDESWTVRHAHALAENQQDDKALQIFEKLLVKDDKPEYRAMSAVLLARMKRVEASQRHIEAIADSGKTATVSYNVACAFALMGDVDKAGKSLARAFELTPPSALAKFKKQAVEDQDLVRLKGTKVLTAALQTKSGVSEAEAVKAGCEGCPSKGSCDKKDAAGTGDKKKK
ncbi:MAG: tetratricopeptide repeat protein [Planctomycetota bacterium]|jgi:tetratricopeptide (TPR) repeat protein